MTSKCAREGCDKYARGDEYCSTHCAKEALGATTDSELQTFEDFRKTKRRETDGPVSTANPHVNLPRHEGPQTRRTGQVT